MLSCVTHLSLSLRGVEPEAAAIVLELPAIFEIKQGFLLPACPAVNMELWDEICGGHLRSLRLQHMSDARLVAEADLPSWQSSRFRWDYDAMRCDSFALPECSQKSFSGLPPLQTSESRQAPGSMAGRAPSARRSSVLAGTVRLQGDMYVQRHQNATRKP